jgi:hypothetical protein
MLGVKARDWRGFPDGAALLGHKTHTKIQYCLAPTSQITEIFWFQRTQRRSLEKLLTFFAPYFSNLFHSCVPHSLFLYFEIDLKCSAFLGFQRKQFSLRAWRGNVRILSSFFVWYQLNRISKCYKGPNTRQQLTRIHIWGSQVVTLKNTIFCPGGHAVAYLVEAPCYKLEGRGFDSRWGY